MSEYLEVNAEKLDEIIHHLKRLTHDAMICKKGLKEFEHNHFVGNLQWAVLGMYEMIKEEE